MLSSTSCVKTSSFAGLQCYFHLRCLNSNSSMLSGNNSVCGLAEAIQEYCIGSCCLQNATEPEQQSKSRRGEDRGNKSCRRCWLAARRGRQLKQEGWTQNTKHRQKPILKYFSFKPSAGSKCARLSSVALVDGGIVVRELRALLTEQRHSLPFCQGRKLFQVKMRKN